MDKEQIMRALYISESDTKEAIKEKLLLVSILNEGIDTADNILKRYKELADIMGI